MAKLFVATLSGYRNNAKYLLHAFVVMPDHFHLLFTTIHGITLERAMQLIKGGFSYRVGKELAIKTGIWERGYIDHRIRDITDFRNHVQYVHENPVEAGLAAAPEDYPYCSACQRFDLDAVPELVNPQASGCLSGTAEAVPSRSRQERRARREM
jgi:putative transposase